MRRNRGFTLIEVMITVVIVAVLAGVAIPSYTDYIRRGHISDGVSRMGAYRVSLEQYYQDNRNYGTANGACGVAVPVMQRFTFTCTVGATAQTYLVTGTGSDAVVGYVYTVNQTGAQATSKFKGETVTKTCWLIRGSEC